MFLLYLASLRDLVHFGRAQERCCREYQLIWRQSRSPAHLLNSDLLATNSGGNVDYSAIRTNLRVLGRKDVAVREPQGLFQGQETNPLPPQVLNLARCKREFALIIYLEGAMTAKWIEARLPRKLSNSALRAMLQRLCRKGILRRQKINGSHNSTDRRIPYLYTPAITVELVRTHALQQVARDYFDGSLFSVAEAVVEGAPGKWIEGDDHAVGRRIRNEHRRLKC